MWVTRRLFCFPTWPPRSPARFSTSTRASAMSWPRAWALLLLQTRRIDFDVAPGAQAADVGFVLRAAVEPFDACRALGIGLLRFGFHHLRDPQQEIALREADPDVGG